MADVALVCGGAGALGSAVVEALRRRGDEVIVADRDVVDLTDGEAVEAFWDALEARPRWVANVAGAFRPGTVVDSEPEEVKLVTDVNLGTAFWSCRSAARRLPEGGAIVNVSARAGLTGGTGSAVYAMAKAGVIRLTQVLALELAEREIRVNAVTPALIDTPANRAQGITGGTTPEAVAATIAFLLSDEAAAVTGAIVPV